MCSPKTMLKMGIAIAIPLGIGFVAFPQFRTAIIGFAPLAIIALCPLTMIFGMKGMKNNEKSCNHCENDHHKESKK